MAFKVSSAHWEIIISFMELHPDFARNRVNGPKGRETMKRLWDELTKKLNAVGLGERNLQKWQKTWTDFKYVLKRKAADIKKDLHGTGGGPPKGALLTELDQRLLNILGPTFHEGIGLPENGCSTFSSPVTQPQNTQDGNVSAGTATTMMLTDHEYIRQPLRKQPKRVTPENNLENMYSETLQELKDIKHILANLNTTAQGIENALLSLVNVLKEKNLTK